MHSSRILIPAFGACVALGSGFGSAAADIPDTIVAAETDLAPPVAIAAGEDDETIVAFPRSVARLDALGDSIDRVAFDAEIVDIATDPTSSQIAVLREDAVVVLDSSLAIAWQQPLVRTIATGRIAMGESGTIAVVAGGRVHAYDGNGRQWLSMRAPVDAASTIAVLDDQGLVVVGGARQDRRCGVQSTEVALVAVDRDGETRWDTWAGAPRDCDAPQGDSRVVDVRRGGDGAIYVLVGVEGPSALLDDGARVGFDASSTQPSEPTARVAWFARVTPHGAIDAQGWFGFPDAFSTVRPDAIDADADGNVYVLGAATHERDEDGFVEAPGGVVGFFQVLEPGLDARRVWRQFAIDDLEGEPMRMAVRDDRAIAIVPATQDDPARIVELPTLPDQTRVEKQPDRDDVGTFGYESGISGADPTCYCDARRTTAPSWWAASVALIVLSRPRRRRP